jgi:hypothetical protein
MPSRLLYPRPLTQNHRFILVFVVQKVDGAVPDPIWEKYCFRRGVVDADHLQLVALERVSQSSWMLHLRLTPPSAPPPS